MNPTLSKPFSCRLKRGASGLWLALSFFLTFTLAACDSKTNSPEPVVAAKIEELPVIESLLSTAIVQNDLVKVKALLAGEIDVNAKDTLGRTPLHMAAFYARLEASALLLEKGAEVNTKDRIGMTPLHAAVIAGGLDGQRKEVQLLLDNQANIAARSDAGQTVLHLAAATGQRGLAKFLIDRGADPHSRDANEKTPLSYATQNKHPKTTALFQQYNDND